MSNLILASAAAFAAGWTARAIRARRRARRWPYRALTEITPRLTLGEHPGLVTVATRTPDDRWWMWSMAEDSTLPEVKAAGRVPDDARELDGGR